MRRLTDTDLWGKNWFLELDTAERLAFFFIKDNCDQVGVWKPSPMLIQFSCGNFDFDSFLHKMVDLGHFEILPNGKIWIIDFIKFHYGDLNKNCKPHKAYIKMAEGHGLKIDIIDTESKKVPPHEMPHVKRARRFYDNELSRFANHERIAGYQKLVDHLFETPMVSVLAIQNQIQFNQFLDILEKANKLRIPITQMLDNMENTNRYTRGKKSLPQTLHNWYNMEQKRRNETIRG